MSLATYQQTFWSSVRTRPGPVAIPEIFRGRGTLDAHARLEIYRTAYWVRQVEALRELFPALVAHLGDGPFAQRASRYLAAHPSRSRAIEDLGAGFPPWLQPDVALSGAAAIELARWRAFVALDAPVLSSLAPAALPALSIGLAPHVQLVPIEASALVIAAPGLQGAGTHWCGWRAGFAVHERLIDDLEARALASSREPRPFAQWCASLGADDPSFITTLLRRWLSRGWLLAPEPP